MRAIEGECFLERLSRNIAYQGEIIQLLSKGDE
jgi:hypothetical protein